MPYVKLDTCVLKSTIWAEPDHVRITWITMLLMADPQGHVDATAPGIAHDARLNLQQVREALKVLESPDPDSRSQNDDGCRIRRVDGGYQIINFLKYREKDHTAAERMRRHRKKKKAEQGGDGVTPNVTEVTRNVTQAEAEAEAKKERVPYEAIKSAYHEALPDLPQCRKLTPARKQNIAARWKDDLPSLDEWRAYFKQVAECPFLLGNNDRGWKADLEWLTKQGNYAKVIEGRFQSAQKKTPTDLGEMTDGDY